jgi:transcriptional regulator with XRE-family HTH domain
VNQMQHDFVASPVAQDYGKILGTPFKVFLSNGVEEKPNKATGKVATDIVDLPGLIASVLQSRVLHPRKLSGDDLKYIRSALRMRSAELAEKLDVTPEHYSRCEAGTKTLSSSTEKFFRMYVYLHAFAKHVAVQEALSKRERENLKCSPEEANEALEAFQSVFLEMKIQHIFEAGDELEFSFCRGPRRVDDDPCVDCGKEDGKWRKQPDRQAA